ncbi:hypothetical protein MMC25_004778 [Agyrium rufum]|nr:hypothetical protein [Agyrium rufum]
MQEELSKLFARNMAVSPEQVQRYASTLVSNETQTASQAPQELSQPQYSISRHYHHSSHLIPKAVPSSNPKTAFSPAPDPLSQAERDLRQNGVDPGTLILPQIKLYSHAPPDQQVRLIQLWTISPPEYTTISDEELKDQVGDWQNTTFEQEEEMAQSRFYRKQKLQESISDTTEDRQAQSSQDHHNQQEMSVQSHYDEDMDLSEDITPSPYQHTEQPAISDHPQQQLPQIAEPYMHSGYEMLARQEYESSTTHAPSFREQISYSPLGSAIGARDDSGVISLRQATDPAYDGGMGMSSEGWWRHDLYGQQPMEHQYGAFEQMAAWGSRT